MSCRYCFSLWYYGGAVYHGTMQLSVDPMGRSMSGKWLEFGKNF